MFRKRWVAAAAMAAAAYAAPTASAETIYGLTDTNDLVVFDSTTPGTTSGVLDVTLPNGVTEIEGIDFRPATLQLFALGRNGQNGQLLRIDIQTGAATAIGGTFALDNTGADYDIDFNPTIDRLRIVSDAEESLVVNPNNGTLQATSNDITPAGQVTGAAYTNNAPASSASDGADAGLRPDQPTTRLLDIDVSGTDRLAEQNVTTGQLTTIGNLNVDLVGDVGFDISTASNTGTGTVGVNTGYLVGRTGDTLDRLYTIDLGSGAASATGEVGGASKVKDLSVAPAIPQIGVLYTPNMGAQQLITYRVDRPGSAGTPVTITGLQGSEELIGIDRRPANDTVYGVSDGGRVYTINLATGAATAVPGGPFAPLPAGDAGVDFNPAPGAAIRVVTDTDQNLAVNSETSAVVVGNGVGGGTLAYATDDPNAGTNPNVTGAAYTNPVTPAPTSTFLYDIDSGVDDLVAQGIEDANGDDRTGAAFGNGVLTTIGDLGVNVLDGNGFDIAARFNHQFGAFTPAAPVPLLGLPALDGPALFAVNVASTAPNGPNGGAVAIGDLAGEPTGSTVAGMTVVQDNVLPAAPTPGTGTGTPTPTPTYTVPTPTPTATPGPYAQKVKPRITARAKPRRDRRKPFIFRVQGKLTFPSSVSKSAGCKGTVRVVAKKGKKVVSKRRTGVKSTCKYKARVKLRKSAGKRGKVKFQVRFLGNSRLLQASARTSAKYGTKRR